MRPLLSALMLVAFLSSPAFAQTTSTPDPTGQQHPGPEFLPTLAAARRGDATAQFNLGAMYELGKGVAHSDADAVNWYRKAADQGEAFAQLNLGGMYDRRRGVAQDTTAALFWFRKAAQQGSAAAQSNLDITAHQGNGASANDERVQ